MKLDFPFQIVKAAQGAYGVDGKIVLRSIATALEKALKDGLLTSAPPDQAFRAIFRPGATRERAGLFHRIDESLRAIFAFGIDAPEFLDELAKCISLMLIAHAREVRRLDRSERQPIAPAFPEPASELHIGTPEEFDAMDSGTDLPGDPPTIEAPAGVDAIQRDAPNVMLTRLPPENATPDELVRHVADYTDEVLNVSAKALISLRPELSLYEIKCLLRAFKPAEQAHDGDLFSFGYNPQ